MSACKYIYIYICIWYTYTHVGYISLWLCATTCADGSCCAFIHCCRTVGDRRNDSYGRVATHKVCHVSCAFLLTSLDWRFSAVANIFGWRTFMISPCDFDPLKTTQWINKNRKMTVIEWAETKMQEFFHAHHKRFQQWIGKKSTSYRVKLSIERSTKWTFKNHSYAGLEETLELFFLSLILIWCARSSKTCNSKISWRWIWHFIKRTAVPQLPDDEQFSSRQQLLLLRMYPIEVSHKKSYTILCFVDVYMGEGSC